MIRFGVSSIAKPSICLRFQSILFEKSNTKLLRLFSCPLFQQFKDPTINTFNPLCLSQDSSFIPCYNPVLSTTTTTRRVFHTMNVSRNQNKEQPSSSMNNQSSSGDNLNEINNQPADPKDKKGRFKALIRDYGLTAVIFHITISLASLGICYLLVNSSLPMEKIFIWLGIDEKLGKLSEAASTSTNFVVAYAVHKSLALIRLSITAACVPVIVRYLRSKGILKPVAKVVKKVN